MAIALCGLQAAQAGGPISHACDRAAPLTAREQDRLLRVADWLRTELDAAGAQVAVASRSGMDLQRFGLRHSHAAVMLRDGLPTRWGVRQLYFACDQGQPRLFDQGLAGFMGGVDDLSVSFLNVLVLPSGADSAPSFRQAAAVAWAPTQAAATARLAAAARSTAQSLALLGQRYSANAYPFATAYQNCNQWLIELMATAWAGPPALAVDGESPAPAGGAGLDEAADTTALQRRRAQAQSWLRQEGYDPAPVAIDSHWVMAAAGLAPFIQLQDHPEDDRFALKLRVSLPRSIEAFVQRKLPDAQRWQLCHTDRHAVLRRSAGPLSADCQSADGDRVLMLD